MVVSYSSEVMVVMYEKLQKVCGEILSDETKTKEFLAMSSIEEMYNFFKSKIPNLSTSEFDDFIVELLENYERMQLEGNTINTAMLQNVSGGAKIDSKVTAASLAILMGIPASGAPASATDGTNKFSTAVKNVGRKVRNTSTRYGNWMADTSLAKKFPKFNAWLKKNPHVASIVSIFLILAAMAGLTYGGFKLKKRYFNSKQPGVVNIGNGNNQEKKNTEEKKRKGKMKKILKKNEPLDVESTEDQPNEEEPKEDKATVVSKASSQSVEQQDFGLPSMETKEDCIKFLQSLKNREDRVKALKKLNKIPLDQANQYQQRIAKTLHDSTIGDGPQEKDICIEPISSSYKKTVSTGLRLTPSELTAIRDNPYIIPIKANESYVNKVRMLLHYVYAKPENYNEDDRRKYRIYYATLVSSDKFTRFFQDESHYNSIDREIIHQSMIDDVIMPSKKKPGGNTQSTTTTMFVRTTTTSHL